MIPSLLFALLIAVAAEPDKPAVPEVEVTGTIATRVEFRGAARTKLAEATLDLLRSCAYSDRPNDLMLPLWNETFLGPASKVCHIYVRFDKPRAVSVGPNAMELLDLEELLVVFPLNGGSLWVRQGDRARRFAKFSPELTVPLQNLLKHAQSIE